MIYFTFDWVFQVGVQSLNVVLLSGVEEEGNVAADRQGDFNRGIQRVLAIVLRNAAADLSGAEADYRVGIGVVVGNPVEDFNAEGALLEDIQIVGQGFFHHVLEQGWVATAAAEVGAGQNPLQLELDGLAVGIRARNPWVSGWGRVQSAQRQGIKSPGKHITTWKWLLQARTFVDSAKVI